MVNSNSCGHETNSLILLNLRITVDTSIVSAIFVHKSDGFTHSFDISDTGLYYSNADDYSGVVLTIATIKDQKTKYSFLVNCK